MSKENRSMMHMLIFLILLLRLNWSFFLSRLSLTLLPWLLSLCNMWKVASRLMKTEKKREKKVKKETPQKVTFQSFMYKHLTQASLSVQTEVLLAYNPGCTNKLLFNESSKPLNWWEKSAISWGGFQIDLTLTSFSSHSEAPFTLHFS